MASFREIRNLLLESFDDDDISEDEFLLLYDVNTSKNPYFPYDCYGAFDLSEMDDSECLAEFRFHKDDVPVLLEALQLPQSFKCHQGTICLFVFHLCFKFLAQQCYLSLTARLLTLNRGSSRPFRLFAIFSQILPLEMLPFLYFKGFKY